MNIYPSKSLPFEPYVYLIGWTDLNKFYIGSSFGKIKNAHPSQLWNSYFTSSKYVKELRKINGEPDIIRIEKTFNDREKCINYEVKLLTRMNVIKDCRFLNKTFGDGKFLIINHTESTREKIRLSKQNMSDETRLKMSNARKNMSDETRLKLSIAGKNISDETRLKMSNARKNMSDETRQKISEGRVGKKHSIEARQKMSEAYKYREYSTETRQKISEGRVGKKHSIEARQKIAIAAKNRQRITCPHCGKIGVVSNMTRWHFDNCKHRLI